MAGKYSSKKFILPFYVFSKSIPLYSRVLLPTLSISSFSIIPFELVSYLFSVQKTFSDHQHCHYFLCVSIVLNLSRGSGCFLRFKTIQTVFQEPFDRTLTNFLQPTFYFLNFSVDILKIWGCFIWSFLGGSWSYFPSCTYHLSSSFPNKGLLQEKCICWYEKELTFFRREKFSLFLEKKRHIYSNICAM